MTKAFFLGSANLRGSGENWTKPNKERNSGAVTVEHRSGFRPVPAVGCKPCGLSGGRVPDVKADKNSASFNLISAGQIQREAKK